jgi:hypothetical protein
MWFDEAKGTAKKTEDPPSQTEGGTPSVVLRLLADGCPGDSIEVGNNEETPTEKNDIRRKPKTHPHKPRVGHPPHICTFSAD